jgi:transposase
LLSLSAFLREFPARESKHQHLQLGKMPSKRQPLGQISGNVSNRKQLTPIERAEIIGASKCGVRPGKIAKDLLVPRTTVYTTIDRAPQRDNHKTRVRSGRPREYTRYRKRILLRVVRQFPKYTYKQLWAFSGLKMHDSTMRRILQRHYITSWRAKRQPQLTKEAAKAWY